VKSKEENVRKRMKTIKIKADNLIVAIKAGICLSNTKILMKVSLILYLVKI
jgi:hypothetical protein